MRRRLEAIGQRSISALVDISNYVMFDLGRPSHIYDRAKLTGPLVARRAKVGETVTALNGKAYSLSDTMTVIADDVGVHGLDRKSIQLNNRHYIATHMSLTL